jgi:hypothetical protein
MSSVAVAVVCWCMDAARVLTWVAEDLKDDLRQNFKLALQLDVAQVACCIRDLEQQHRSVSPA